MSLPRGFGPNGGRLFSNMTGPCEVQCNFVVDQANGNGLGIRSLKSNGYINNVFMHTSATPGVNNGSTNPNPAVGYAVVQFKNNFNKYINGYFGIQAPLASSNLTSVVAGNPYVITSLGTTTLAQWVAAGLNPGLTPTVGQAFIALTSAALGGSGTVGAPGVPVISQVSVVGDPNNSIANSAIAFNAGAIIVVSFLGATAAGNTALVVQAPANNSVIAMNFVFDNSSVTIDGL